jgi:hypothetical protein
LLGVFSLRRVHRHDQLAHRGEVRGRAPALDPIQGFGTDACPARQHGLRQARRSPPPDKLLRQGGAIQVHRALQRLALVHAGFLDDACELTQTLEQRLAEEHVANAIQLDTLAVDYQAMLTSHACLLGMNVFSIIADIGI